ncbi:uncharacterized protein [Henckelia pumila]|uniref:uncharacterized protein isoform X2 n=1 Tax=Henckelia pumila TaxID=405737 RepID=UPI003C6E5485
MKPFTSIKFFIPLHILGCLILWSIKPILGVTSSLRQGVGVRCLERERLALLNFKDGLRYAERMDSWGNEDHKKDCCKWQGVLCHNRTNHVVALNLKDVYLIRGNISEALGNLVALSYLDLSGQELEGRIPYALGNLTFLSHLDLSNNRLEGGIPDSLGNLIHLSHLDLSQNKLEDGIPHTFGNLRSLSHLYMSLYNGRYRREYGMITPEAWGNPETLSRLKGSWIPEAALGNLTSLVHVDLSFNSLGGRIPDVLGNLTFLVHVDLSGNNLQGRIPDSLGNLRSLSNLSLSYNMLEDGIPPSFGELKFLSLLLLRGNNLQGRIPDSFRNLASLLGLDLAHNKLDGGIPSALGNLTSLLGLDLSANMLEGRIPDSLGNLASLVWLDLSYNKLDGGIPTALGNLVSLTYMDLHQNKLQKRIPNSFGNLASLVQLDLSFNILQGLEVMKLRNNKISGTLNGICSDTNVSDTKPYNLNLLDVSNNLLSGELPTCLHNLESLMHINLANNNFSGEIQDTFRWPRSLSSLHLWNNSFRGEILKSLRGCSGLHYLVLGKNYFRGKIPAWIGERLSHLSVLSLASNYFYGSLPSTLCNLQNLQVLDISSNKISGIIPSCLNNLMSMHSDETILGTRKHNSTLYSWAPPGEDDRVNVEWKGNEAEENPETLLFLKFIDLSGNNLVGEIPNEVTDLDGLIALNLSGNHLVGSIPRDIGRLQLLNFLDLSKNNLTGSIPDVLSQMSHLGVLNLSYNNLSGKIPWNSHLMTFNSYSFLGNPKLCGAPLSYPCPGDDEKHVKPNFTNNADGKDVDKFISKGFYISMMFGFILGFWCVFAALLLNRTCRFAYFRMLVAVKDWLYVKIVACYNRWHG